MFRDPITVDFGEYQGSALYFTSKERGEETQSLEDNTTSFKDIETITFPGGRVEIQYGGNRGLISSMQVYNSKTGNEKIFEATFSHLDRLLSCVDLGAAGKYDFEYDPNRFHNPDGRDMWGYYNGKYNDYQLSPSMTVKRCEELGILRRGYIYGADRHDDFNYIQANILKKVTYPTGGTCSWEYEPHSFEPCYPDSLLAYCFGDSVLTRGGGVRVKRITMSPSASSSEQEIVTDYIYGRNEDGKGICEQPAFPSSFISLQKRLAYSTTIPNMLYEDYLMTVERNSKSTDSNAGFETIWYPRVTEISSEV